MDIDEFLDRELSDLDLETGKTEKNEPLAEFQDESPLAENIRADLSKGNIEQAEQAYMQLWHILSQQKLKWNKELYDQLTQLGRQFAGMLNQAYADAKSKSGHITELISRARAALQQGKKEAPFKLYSEMQEIFNSIPSAFFDERRIIEAQISDFYRELKGTTDNELLKRVYSLIAEISQLIDKINLAIRSNDIINATVNYNKCIELYNQVPEGFLRHKNSLGMRLLEIYRSLSISNEISNLQRQLVQQPQFQQPEIQVQGQAQAPMNAGARKERAKKNMEKGFFNEAFKDIQEALKIEPNDAEAKALQAKIKTLQ
ncbi:hypothetical protein HYX07_03495 [Candidatus Woesearchaeota archaeon]|nr:hypothetical protein [Candidatus Woesearchaeota archaeon]